MRRRRTLKVIGSILAALVVVVSAAWFFEDRLDRGPGVCTALNSYVDGLRGFDWDNGMTGSGSEWGSVLTDGVEYAVRAERPGIAAAVRADDDGYRDLVDALPADLRPAVARLHALVIEPDAGYAHRKDASVQADAAAVGKFSVERCNLI